MSVPGSVHLHVCVLQCLWFLTVWEFSVILAASHLKLSFSICHSQSLSNKEQPACLASLFVFDSVSSVIVFGDVTVKGGN